MKHGYVTALFIIHLDFDRDYGRSNRSMVPRRLSIIQAYVNSQISNYFACLLFSYVINSSHTSSWVLFYILLTLFSCNFSIILSLVWEKFPVSRTKKWVMHPHPFGQTVALIVRSHFSSCKCSPVPLLLV